MAACDAARDSVRYAFATSARSPAASAASTARHRVRDARVDPLVPVREAGLADPDPAGELAHHLQRRDPLAPLDPRDVRGAAAGERELPLADPRRLARGMKPLPNGNRIVVVRRPRTLQDPRPPSWHGSDAQRNCQDQPRGARPPSALPSGAARPSGWRRMPTVTADAMLATSHPSPRRPGSRPFARAATRSTPRWRRRPADRRRADRQRSRRGRVRRSSGTTAGSTA